MQAESDIAAALTAWGRWQPALAPGRGPSVAEALVGSLGGKGAERRVSTLICCSSHNYIISSEMMMATTVVPCQAQSVFVPNSGAVVNDVSNDVCKSELLQRSCVQPVTQASVDFRTLHRGAYWRVFCRYCWTWVLGMGTSHWQQQPGAMM